MPPRLTEYWWVFFGGGLGALCRHLLVLTLPPVLSMLGGRLQEAVGILVVNALGCLLLGMVVSLTERFSAWGSLRPLVVVGFLGGFTTYSSFQLSWLKLFSHEGLALLPQSPLTPALVGQVLGYPLLSLVGGWVGFGLGYLAMKTLLETTQ